MMCLHAEQKPPSAVSSLTRNTGIWSPQAPHLAKQQLSALQETTVLLRRAFSAPGSRPINIFGVAAALAEGELHIDVMLCACIVL